MTDSWKVSVFFACLAFCVSLLFGLIGGVGFGTIILRAFLGALVFGGLGFGLELLLRRILPELFVPHGEPGSLVDITEPEINPHERSSADDFVEESGGDFREAESSAGDEDDLVEEIEEAPHSETSPPVAAAAAADSPQPAQAAEGEAAGDFDVLPDVSDLDASFAAGDDSQEDGVMSKPPGGSSKAGAITEDQNPELLAKVVQTVIKRDKEG
ncbi:MAG: hypothetical protein LBK13_01865 [Spirochaetales bacterium]|jgi:hypothetical protein|nr:hypothetical protein [Spirochaetales bacterium]